MAEGGVKTVLCRYFMNGVCREGDRCHFSHNRDSSRPSMICRYYLKGNCYYGRSCRYDHTWPGHQSGSEYNQTEGPPQHLGESSQQGPACTDTSRHKDGLTLPAPHVQSSQPSLLSQSKPNKDFSSTSQSSHVTSNTSNSSISSSSLRKKGSSGSPSNSNSVSCVVSQGRQAPQPLLQDSRVPSWVDAPEFVPKLAKEDILNSQPDISTSLAPTDYVSYAQVVGAGNKETSSTTSCGSDGELCPTYLMSGKCQLGEQCSYIHGLMCEVCQLACLHPFDEEQRRIHKEECTKLMEAEMEHSFAVARSKDKVCGICMDTVMERPLASQRRFGILPNCAHCFCLNCIRKWRQSKQFENKIIRSCPECRTQSDFVIPSRYWVDDKDKEEKDKLLLSYQQALSDKPCKYFKQGEGQCPFGNKCFYLHALPDGTKKDVGPPRRRRRFNADGELQQHLDNMALWDFVLEREHRLELLRGSIQTLLLELELEDLADEFYFADDSVSEASDL
ncbi:E3 ubiquitin-protein ligase makorin-2-like [Scylla paramamosain]